MISYPVHISKHLFLQFAVAIAALLLAALVIFWFALHPIPADLGIMFITFVAAALVTLAIGYLAHFRSLMQRIPIASTLLWSQALGAIIIVGTVAVAAKMLFVSDYDSMLAVLLVLFAVGLALALGYYQSAIMNAKLDALTGAADALSSGKVHARVEIEGQDALARLATVFNALAAHLNAIDRKERQLDRLRADLSTWISFDLRVPLTSVRSLIETLATGSISSPELYTRYIRTARRDANALADLLDDLNDIAQVDVYGVKLQRAPADIRLVIDEVVRTLQQAAAEKGISIFSGVAPGIAPLLIDERQIGRVLINLAKHAISRTPAGGAVKLNAYPMRAGALVEVVDIYEGVRPEDINHIFELFFSDEDVRSRAARNSRLSLAMAKAIVQAHGSQIRAESLPGKGLRLVFPLSRHGDSTNPLGRGM
ncbi:MAG: hypothetical protein IPK16_19255 [Anaerolineales bacterium]|nr:hypothetical protein [Anaerolineales bacterium]